MKYFLRNHEYDLEFFTQASPNTTLLRHRVHRHRNTSSSVFGNQVTTATRKDSCSKLRSSSQSKIKLAYANIYTIRRRQYYFKYLKANNDCIEQKVPQKMNGRRLIIIRCTININKMRGLSCTKYFRPNGYFFIEVETAEYCRFGGRHFGCFESYLFISELLPDLIPRVHLFY